MLKTDDLARQLVNSIKAGLQDVETYEGGQLFDRYIDFGLPRNAYSGRHYSGRNILELWVSQAERAPGYVDKRIAGITDLSNHAASLY